MSTFVYVRHGDSRDWDFVVCDQERDLLRLGPTTRDMRIGQAVANLLNAERDRAREAARMLVG